MPAPKAFPQFQRAQRNTIGQLVSLPKNVSRYAHVNQFVHSQEVTYAHVELISLYLCDRRLIIRDSVEEWMLTLQQQKRGLSERTLGDDEGEGSTAETIAAAAVDASIDPLMPIMLKQGRAGAGAGASMAAGLAAALGMGSGMGMGMGMGMGGFAPGAGAGQAAPRSAAAAAEHRARARVR